MTNQVSLESEFIKQDCSDCNNKYVQTEAMKKCKKCGQFKPKSEFHQDDRCRSGIIGTCKECRTVYMKKYNAECRDNRILKYNTNKEKIREHNFLYGKTRGKYLFGYFYGCGVCLICGEIHPKFLENHHATSDDDGFVVSLCANHHRCYRSNNREAHMSVIRVAIEKSGFLWDSEGQPRDHCTSQWRDDLTLKEAVRILKDYDISGYEPISVEVG